MKTNVVIGIVVAVLVIIAGYFLFVQPAGAPMNENQEQATSTPDTAAPAESSSDDVTVITYTDSGFSPSTVNISVGDTVRFVNNSSSGMWVGADEHPTHTEYDGTSTREHCANGAATGSAFDQCSANQAGSSWEYTFTKAGTFEYHNHVRSDNGGTVVVSE